MVIFSSVANSLPCPTNAGLQDFRSRVHQHDAPPVGLDPLENQFHDPLQELIDVERMADGQGGTIHDLQIAACPGEPRVLRHFGLKIEDPAAFFLASRLMIRESSSCSLREPILITLARSSSGLFAGAGKKHQRAAHLQLIAAVEPVLPDALAVDVRAIGTVQIRDGKCIVLAANFGMMAGDFGVVQLDVVRCVATDADDRSLEFEPGALIDSPDYE